MLTRFGGAYTISGGCSSCGRKGALVISSQVRFSILFPSGYRTFDKGVAYELEGKDLDHAMLLKQLNKYLFEQII